MKLFGFFLCFVLLFAVLSGAGFAENKKKNEEDNPYGFAMVNEVNSRSSSGIRPHEGEYMDMKKVNENDTYQAQSNVDAAAMRKFEKKAARISKKVQSEENSRPGNSGEPKTRMLANKAAEMIEKVKENPKINKITGAVKAGWKKFKKWFVKLPGIRHWLASPYSMENYKKELGKIDYVERKVKKEQLKKNSATAQKLKEGSRRFFK